MCSKCVDAFISAVSPPGTEISEKPRCVWYFFYFFTRKEYETNALNRQRSLSRCDLRCWKLKSNHYSWFCELPKSWTNRTNQWIHWFSVQYSKLFDRKMSPKPMKIMENHAKLSLWKNRYYLLLSRQDGWVSGLCGVSSIFLQSLKEPSKRIWIFVQKTYFPLNFVRNQ